MAAVPGAAGPTFVHDLLPSGVEFAADVLPERQTVAIHFRMLWGASDEPPELSGLHAITERTLSKGTENYDGRALADAFDLLGAQWGTASGRQSTLLRVVCLPEFVSQAVSLAAETLCRPTFPAHSCLVAVQLAQESLRHLDDEPGDVARVMINRLALGERYGRYLGGELDTLPRIHSDEIRAHWQKGFHRGRLQVSAAGPVDARRLADQIDEAFGALGEATPRGRDPVSVTFQPRRDHRERDLKQQYIAIALPGAPRSSPEFPVEQVLLAVLSGGMSGRLFTEVREKLGLVYWVSAWAEQLRGLGVIHLGASTTPERCEQTYSTLMRELLRVGADLTDDETQRAKNQLIAHALTEDDLTRARAAGLSDDLFHFGRPIGLEPKLESVRRVTTQQVRDYGQALRHDLASVATVGPVKL